MYWSTVELSCHVTLSPILSEPDRKPQSARTIDFWGMTSQARQPARPRFGRSLTLPAPALHARPARRRHPLGMTSQASQSVKTSFGRSLTRASPYLRFSLVQNLERFTCSGFIRDILIGQLLLFCSWVCPPSDKFRLGHQLNGIQPELLTPFL
jgi:hypothetical protein